MTEPLSKNQKHILKLMQEGWACGVHILTSGHTKIFSRGILQKNGLGTGAPVEHVKAQTVYSLEARDLVYRLNDGYSLTETLIFKLTEKGKQEKIK